MNGSPGSFGIPVCDLHCDTVLELQAGADLASHPSGHVDIARMRRGGVGLQVFACFVPSGIGAERAFTEANALLTVLQAACEGQSHDIQRVTDVEEIDSARAAGRIAAMPAIENGLVIAGQVKNLEHFRSRGVRYITLTHARHLDWAASSGEEWTGDSGLTAFGEEVVREMNRLGIVVDVSHVHEKTFWDVVRVAKRPFIASHSNAYALCAVGRNLTDDQLRAIRDSGGMVGINFFPGFLDPAYLPSLGSSMSDMFRSLEETEIKYFDDPPRKLAAVRELSAPALARLGPAAATIDTVCNHIEYIVRLIGDDHVGFGSDFDGVQQLPNDLPDCSAFPLILDRLRSRGMKEESIRKIAWDNFIRVLKEV